MKNLIFTFVLLFTVSFAFGQSSADNYKSDKDGWLVNLDEAYSLSKKTGKPIMANFTGSDWCGWCKRLDAAVFSQDEFKSWANDNVVLLELDFPRRTKLPTEIQQQNAGLQRAFRVQGFPTIWVFDLDKDAASGKYKISAIGKTGYTPTVQQFTTGVDQMLTRAKQAGS
ncbi:MAG: thioredoxin family protein [Saprospiraceae bacterium]|nr:thioredoxin family protein [Saprospiraceae bacterium]